VKSSFLEYGVKSHFLESFGKEREGGGGWFTGCPIPISGPRNGRPFHVKKALTIFILGLLRDWEIRKKGPMGGKTQLVPFRRGWLDEGGKGSERNSV